MFDITTTSDATQTELKSVEQLQQLADYQLALIGGGTGAVNLE